MSSIVRKFKKINKKLIKIKFCYNPMDIFYEIYNYFFYNFFKFNLLKYNFINNLNDCN